ncbi:tetratricopeptide repeat protein, partial [Opisthorchis viverrini]
MDDSLNTDYGFHGGSLVDQELQIVDLDSFITTGYELSYDLDALGVDDVPGFPDDGRFLNDLIPDESLYSRYLNGLITFDELMREMHRKESCTQQRTRGSRRAQGADDIGDDAEEEEEEISESTDDSSDPEYVPSKEQRRRKARKKRAPKNRLSVELAQYLGEAERFLNNDQFDEAEEICRTIIASAPNSSPPYVVLAEIYYRRGDHEKSTEYMFEAAQRNPGDTSLWLSLIDFAEEKNDLALAMHYTKLALRGDRQNSDIRRRLIQYYERAGQSRSALMLRLSALSVNPESSGEKQFQLARSLADEFFKLMDRPSSIRAYESAFEKYPDSGTDADKNTTLSMMLQLRKYENALKFLLRYCNVSITTEAGKPLRWDRLTEQLKHPNKYTNLTFPETTPPELYMKLFLILIHLKLSAICIPFVRASLTEENAEKYFDWLLDIIKSFRTYGLHSAAGEMLLKLTILESTKQMPLVWTMLAEVQVELGQVEKAMLSYRHVLDTLAPRHTEARVALGGLLKRVGRHEEALDLMAPSNVISGQSSSRPTKRPSKVPSSLSKSRNSNRPNKLRESQRGTMPSEPSDTSDQEHRDRDDDDDFAVEQAKRDAKWLKTSSAVSDASLLSNDPVAYRIAFERCKMLDHPDSAHQFMDEAWNVLFTDVARLCGPDWAELAVILDNSRLRARLMSRLGTNDHSCKLVTSRTHGLKERNVTTADIWSLYLRLIGMLMAEMPNTLAHLEAAAIWGGLLPAIYNDESRRAAASNLLISSCLVGHNGTPAYFKLREIYKKWSHQNQYWNLMNIAILLARDFRQCRLLDRFNEDCRYPLGIISNNDCIVRGSHRLAIARLIGLREQYPHDPLIALLLGVGFLGVSLHKHIASHHPPILQGLGFLNEYRRIRGYCQEVYYNIARFCHQLMLCHIAIEYYEKVLKMEPVGNTEEEKALTDLRSEAAFNLALIYRTNGNRAMAHHLIQSYLVI